MKASGIHSSLDEPPTSKRAGKNASESSKGKQSSLSEAITHAAVALSGAYRWGFPETPFENGPGRLPDVLFNYSLRTIVILR